MFIAGSILLIYQYCYAHHHFVFKWKHALLYAQVIIFGVYLTYILRFWGLAHLASAKPHFYSMWHLFLQRFIPISRSEKSYAPAMVRLIDRVYRLISNTTSSRA